MFKFVFELLNPLTVNVPLTVISDNLQTDNLQTFELCTDRIQTCFRLVV